MCGEVNASSAESGAFRTWTPNGKRATSSEAANEKSPSEHTGSLRWNVEEYGSLRPVSGQKSDHRTVKRNYFLIFGNVRRNSIVKPRARNARK